MGTDLLQPFKVLPEEGHGALGPSRAQLDDAFFEQPLDVVLLDVLLALPQALLLHAAGARCRHAFVL